MDEMNVCRFVPLSDSAEWIHIINFIYETKYRDASLNKLDTSYKMAYVSEGSCTLSCRGVRQAARKGDVFFTFPSVPYTLTGDSEFRFIYVSFIGVQASLIMEKLHITPQVSVYPGYGALLSLWDDAVHNCDQLPELAAQGVLFYTFSKIGCDVLKQEEQGDVTSSAYKMQMVKKYIDDHFSDSTLSLESISREFSYSKKHLSSAFKQQFKVGISEYLTTVRINHACVLMEQKHTSVKDIAYLCGFSEQLYFSRVFRKKMGMSPREHMKMLI